MSFFTTSRYTLKNNSPKTNEELLALAPSVASAAIGEKASEAYKQVRTLDVVDLMRGEGWLPMMAKQTNVRLEGRREVCKHEIRFQRQGDTSISKVGDESLQAILTNSHDCTTSFIFRLGVFRLVCSNGMVVPREIFGEERIRHIGFAPSMIGEVASKLANQGQIVAANVDNMKAITLTEDEQGVFAVAASKLIFDDEAIQEKGISFDPSRLLRVKRYDDKGNDLWRVFNRVQENTLKGGLRYTTGNGVGSNWKRASTRAVKNIDRDIKLNQALWTLANEMAKIKAA